MFYDHVKIHLKAGNGGKGAVSFRREKYIPFGGPSGGDGGNGGDIVFIVSHHLNTLYHFAHKREFEAENGINGRTKDMHGAAGPDLELLVPPGTLVLDDESNEVLADLTLENQRAVIVKGGRGGRGNARFSTSKNQAPRIAENGDLGEAREVRLELKLIADVGLVGKPNAGKSTLLSVTTAAKPQIAPYPFTTLQPNLGVVALDVNTTFVIADMPGLIAGASLGKGLGHEFLRHIERTRVLIHLVDGSALDPLEDFESINAELVAFGHGLSDKPQIIAINKLDIPGVREILPDLRTLFTDKGYNSIIGVSALTRENVRQLIGVAYQLVQEAPEPELKHPLPTIMRPTFLDDEAISVKREFDGAWRVRGGKVERAVRRTQIKWDDAVFRLHGYLERQGVLAALQKAGVEEGDTVRIAEYEFEWRSRDY